MEQTLGMGFCPPPWELNEQNRDRTEGWLAFQEFARTNKEYINNLEEYELSIYKTK